MAGSRLGTYTITDAKTITTADNVGYLSVACLTGTVVVTMTGKTIPSWGNNSSISLSESQAISIQDTVTLQPLDGISIDASGGSAAIIVG